jgi:hypothetical protein
MPNAAETVDVSGVPDDPPVLSPVVSELPVPTFTIGVEPSSPPQAVNSTASDNADARARNFPDIFISSFRYSKSL